MLQLSVQKATLRLLDVSNIQQVDASSSPPTSRFMSKKKSMPHQTLVENLASYVNHDQGQHKLHTNR